MQNCRSVILLRRLYCVKVDTSYIYLMLYNNHKVMQGENWKMVISWHVGILWSLRETLRISHKAAKCQLRLESFKFWQDLRGSFQVHSYFLWQNASRSVFIGQKPLLPTMWIRLGCLRISLTWQLASPRASGGVRGADGEGSGQNEEEATELSLT